MTEAFDNPIPEDELAQPRLYLVPDMTADAVPAEVPVDAEATPPAIVADNTGLVGQFTRYAAWRSAANAEWITGIGIGIAANVAPTPARWGIAAATGITVNYLERLQTRYAARKKKESYEAKDAKAYEAPNAVKEVFSGMLSMYQGAGASIEVNDSIGLPNTTRRNRIHCALYGLAVGAWASPVATKIGTKFIEEGIDNPPRTIIGVAVGSVVGMGAFKGINRLFMRHWRKQAQTQEN